MGPDLDRIAADIKHLSFDGVGFVVSDRYELPHSETLGLGTVDRPVAGPRQPG